MFCLLFALNGENPMVIVASHQTNDHSEGARGCTKSKDRGDSQRDPFNSIDVLSDRVLLVIFFCKDSSYLETFHLPLS